MTDFPFHTLDSAPADAKPLLEGARKKMGFVPNLFSAQAEAPELLNAYLTVSGLFENTSLSPVERTVVLAAVSAENNCEFCVAAHTAGAKAAKVDEAVIQAVRDNKPIDDPKLEALNRFARLLVRERGWAPKEEVQAFLDAGYTPRNVLEVVLGVGLKTLSNYTNHLVGTPLNSELEPFRWEPAKRAAE